MGVLSGSTVPLTPEELDDFIEKPSCLQRTWKKISNIIPTRYVVAIMAFLGLTNAFAMRFNLNIGIVAMVKEPGMHNSSISLNKSLASFNSTTDSSDRAEFDWDERTRGVILGSFFWGYLITQLPGGRLAEMFGGKMIFGIGILCTAIFTLLTPVAARLGYQYLIGARVIMGLCEGVTFPAMYSLLAKFCPPLERSQMFTFVVKGVAIAGIVTGPICGLLLYIDLDNGWPFIFYFFGIGGVIWFALWNIFVYNSPAVHPRISIEEKDFIEKSLQTFVDPLQKVPVPWKSIATSLPFWSILIGKIGLLWGLNFSMMAMPLFLKTILHFNMKESAYLTATPYAAGFVVGMITAITADVCRRKNLCSTTAARKFCNTLGNVGPAACFIALAHLGQSRVAAIILFTLSICFIEICNAGCFINHVDLAPRFAGTLFGLTNTVASATGIAAPYFTGYVINENPTLERWSIAFYVAAGFHVLTGAFYLIFASGDEQSWNNPIPKKEKSNGKQKGKKEIENSIYVVSV